MSKIKNHDTELHFHKDDKGLFVKCYHKVKTNYVGFFVGMTLGFPFEHFLYEKVWPFYLLTHWIHGL